MAFLLRDFAHPAHTATRKRERSLTMFFDGDKLVAAYSYNTVLAVVVPDAEQVSGLRVYLNRTTYSKCSTEHMWSVMRQLEIAYPGLVELAGDAYSVPVGTTAMDLPGLCKPNPLPNFVRSKPIDGRVHLTIGDMKRHNREKIHAHSDGRQIDVLFTTLDGEDHMVTVTEGETDIAPIGENWYGDDCTDYTLSPDLYAFLINTQAKLAELAEARGGVHVYAHGRSYIDMTYGKKSA